MLLLHISDIHFRVPHCLNPDLDPDRPYRTTLIRDVKSRVGELGPVSAILVGGDIAFAGLPEEYRVATTWIRELAAVAGCPPERIFVIPGNHDVDRRLICETPAIRAYNDFAKILNCQIYLPDRLYWKQDLELHDKVLLRIHGLTSTLLSGMEGKDDIRPTLYLSPLQTVLDPVEDVVNLVLCHHPPDWLLDQDVADEDICGRAAIQMFGHKHRQRITREATYVRFSAGAVNPDRNEPGWLPGYNLINLQITGAGQQRAILIDAHLRAWQPNPPLFRAVLTQQEGQVFRHTIPFPESPRAPIVNGERAKSESIDKSEPFSEVPTFEAGSDVEAGMGDPITRNLVFRFWNLTGSQRREIALGIGLITEQELQLPEPERYGRALIRAGERGQLHELARQITAKEMH
jgi:predicted phosphodiesterase